MSSAAVFLSSVSTLPKNSRSVSSFILLRFQLLNSVVSSTLVFGSTFFGSALLPKNSKLGREQIREQLPKNSKLGREQIREQLPPSSVFFVQLSRLLPSARSSSSSLRFQPFFCRRDTSVLLRFATSGLRHTSHRLSSAWLIVPLLETLEPSNPLFACSPLIAWFRHTAQIGSGGERSRKVSSTFGLLLCCGSAVALHIVSFLGGCLHGCVGVCIGNALSIKPPPGFRLPATLLDSNNFLRKGDAPIEWPPSEKDVSATTLALWILRFPGHAVFAFVFHVEIRSFMRVLELRLSTTAARGGYEREHIFGLLPVFLEPLACFCCQPHLQ